MLTVYLCVHWRRESGGGRERVAEGIFKEKKHNTVLLIQLFKINMGKKILMFLACAVMSAGMAFAQQQVTGTVIDSDTGEPLVGATVKVKGTNQGALTDMDGKFTLKNLSAKGKTLVISCMGMKSVEVQAKPNLTVNLEPAHTDLQDVMVVAYGTATKASFTGSAAKISEQQIEQLQASNALEAVTGHVAGVELYNPTGDPTNDNPTIRVRGISSINAGTSPLIILDGTPYSGDMNTINTNDIESLTVMKDAAANALYGARGANGVIVITTKKGKAGQGAKVTLDAKWGSNSRAQRQYKVLDNPGKYYELYYAGLKNYATNKMGYTDAQAHAWANSNLTAENGYGLAYNVYDVPSGQTLIGTNGRLNPNAKRGRIVNFQGTDYLMTGDDWMDETYHNGLRQEYNVRVTDATERSNFLASFGYLNNDGIVDNSNFTRFNGRLKADLQAKPWLKVGANMSYTHYSADNVNEDGTANSSGNIFAAASQFAPIYNVYMRDAQGNKMHDANGFLMYDYGGKNGSWMGVARPILPNSSALQDQILNTIGSEGNAATANGFAEVRIAKDFKITSTNTVTLDESRGTSFTNPYYGAYASSNGMLIKSHARRFTYAFQQLVSWGHQFGKHDAEVMVGHESFRNKYYYLAANKTNMFDPTNMELNGAVTDGSPSSYTTDYNNEGFFGRAQYNYAQKYFGSVSYRRDGSSRFHPDNRWGSFYSVGAAWVISEENFMKNVKPVDFLKFKISYGEQGNDNIGDYLYTNTYTIVNSAGGPAAKPRRMGNKDITWEKGGNLNIGLDFELFKSRLNGTVEYFWRKTSDMLFSFQLPTSYGFIYYYANVGDMKNSGIEVSLDGDVIRTKNVKWNIGVNLTHYKNHISMLPEERKTTVTKEGYKGYASANFFLGEGLSMYSFYMPEYAGVYNKNTWQYTNDTKYDASKDGLSMWYTDGFEMTTNADGTRTITKDAQGNQVKSGKRATTTDYSSAEDYVVGNMIPKLYGGFNTRLEFYGVDFSADFAYQIGGKVYDDQYAQFMSSPKSGSQGFNLHEDLLKSWSAGNQNSNLPRFQYGDDNSGSLSSRFLTKGSYLSLQNLSLGYTLPASVTRKAKIDKVRVYMNASNVWLWSARRGLDPRTSWVNPDGTRNDYGTSNASYYSTVRTISAGVNVTF